MKESGSTAGVVSHWSAEVRPSSAQEVKFIVFRWVLLPAACARLLGAESAGYAVRPWQTAKDLPQNSVTSTAQTPAGFFDGGWGDGRNALGTYDTHLPAGDYRFEVSAYNDGIWNEADAGLELRVAPPWWISWWFRSVALAGAAGSILWIKQTRLNRAKRQQTVQRALSRRLIEAQEEERKRIAAELHDSLGQNLLVIKNRALLGLRDAAETGNCTEQFMQISNMASASLSEVRAISHALRPYQLDRLGLTKALQAMVTSVATASGLKCRAQIETIDGLLPESQEIHCYRVAQELLNNVVEHSHASEALVSARQLNRKLVLVVEDDGCGFDPTHARTATPQQRGMGLRDVADRVHILEGTCRCDSQRARGTRWIIEIPVSTKPA